jgi:hypothetical protein
LSERESDHGQKRAYLRTADVASDATRELLGDDLCTPWCIHAVATLRIPDHIAAGTSESMSLPWLQAATTMHCTGCCAIW